MGSLAASLESAHKMPTASPRCDNLHVPRLDGEGGGQRCPQLRNTEAKVMPANQVSQISANYVSGAPRGPHLTKLMRRDAPYLSPCCPPGRPLLTQTVSNSLRATSACISKWTIPGSAVYFLHHSRRPVGVRARTLESDSLALEAQALSPLPVL